MRDKILITLSVICLCSSLSTTYAVGEVLNVAELRLVKARETMPVVFEPLSDVVSDFEAAVQGNKSVNSVKRAIERYSDALWRQATKTLKENQNWDDRSLYWARLEMRKVLKDSPGFIETSNQVKNRLLGQLELLSRGQRDSHFSRDADVKILVTGFDPFFLDRNIDQSNPSGVAALWLDGMQFESDGLVVEIQSYVVPVRFQDFDEGMIEVLLAPHYSPPNYQMADMIATISMGRTEFDLERFPGRRRSAKAPDNLNVLTGANAENPLIPLLDGAPIEGPEFVEFSLPVHAMQKATGVFKIIDNHKVRTLNGEMMPDSLKELDNEIAVSGAGGGYLSNEISYRSILLRDAIRPDLPVGHIHTPRIKAFEPETTAKIVMQIQTMLKHAASSLSNNK